MSEKEKKLFNLIESLFSVSSPLVYIYIYLWIHVLYFYSMSISIFTTNNNDTMMLFQALLACWENRECCKRVPSSLLLYHKLNNLWKLNYAFIIVVLISKLSLRRTEGNIILCSSSFWIKKSLYSSFSVFIYNQNYVGNINIIIKI